METRQFEVAIVGAGPGGLAAAVTLGEHGVSTLVVERRTSPSPLPRANAASTGTMELLRRWGLERRVRERALDVEFRAWATPSLTAGTGEAVDVGFPSREQAMLVSPTAPAAIGQDDLEPLLEARARSFASVRVERGAELLGLDADNDGYALTVCDPSAGAKPVRARYVIGADGMHSAVRSLLGIATTGSDDLATRVAVHFRAPLWELLSERRHVIYFLTGDFADQAFIPVGRPDRWVFAMNPDHAAADERGLARHLADAAGAPDLEIAIDRVMPVTYGTSLAERFREGDAFLIGDAAHRVTPRGATGLNTAIRDGFDIGWKLAWVLRRLGRPGAARQLRARTATGRGVQHAAVEPRGRLAAREWPRAQRGHRRPHPPPLGGAGRATGVHPGSARPRPHALRRARVGGPSRGRRRGLAARHRGASGRNRGSGTRADDRGLPASAAGRPSHRPVQPRARSRSLLVVDWRDGA